MPSTINFLRLIADPTRLRLLLLLEQEELSVAELQEILGENYTVSDKIETILARVSEGASLKFSDLFTDMASRVEIVVTFLALLELIRLKQVRAIQPGQFGEIEIVAAA